MRYQWSRQTTPVSGVALLSFSAPGDAVARCAPWNPAKRHDWFAMMDGERRFPPGERRPIRPRHAAWSAVTTRDPDKYPPMRTSPEIGRASCRESGEASVVDV